MDAKKRKDLDKKRNELMENFKISSTQKNKDGSIQTKRYNTGSVTFDLFTGGGLPAGKAIGIGAEEGAGKTTMVLDFMFNVLENYPDKKALFIDAEAGLAVELIEAMGYSHHIFSSENPDGRAFLAEASTIQDINRLIKVFTQYPELAIIVIDSTNNVIDVTDIEEDDLGATKNVTARKARLWSNNVGALNYVVSRSNACLILIHQARSDLSGFRVRTVSANNRALRHLATMEIWGSVKGFIAEDETISNQRAGSIGALLELSVSKNKLGLPFQKTEIPIYFGRGVSNKWAYRTYLEENTTVVPSTGEERPYLERKGAWYFLTLPSGEYKGQGNSKAWEMIEENFDEIVKLVEDRGGFQIEYLTAEEAREIDAATGMGKD